MTTTRLALAIVLAALVPAAAQAQTGPCPNTPVDTLALNPVRACFVAASAHTSTDPVSGAAVIDRYEMLWIADGQDPATAQPVQRANLGKPTPNSDNTIWINTLPAYPIGQRFRAVIASISTLASLPPAAREVRSDASNPFGVSTATAPTAPTRPRLIP